MKYLLHWQGVMELPDLTVQKGSVKLLKERWESASALTPSLAFQCLPAPRSLAPEKTSRGSTVEEAPVDSGRADVIKEEPLGSPRQIETFPITIKELQSRFETLGGRKVSTGRLCSWKWLLLSHWGLVILALFSPQGKHVHLCQITLFCKETAADGKGKIMLSVMVRWNIS